MGVRLGVVVLVLVAATVVGLVALWPGQRTTPPPPLVIAGGSFRHARVLALHQTARLDDGTPGGPNVVCGRAEVELTDGVDAGRRVSVDVPPESVIAGLGGAVVLVRTPGASGGAAADTLQDVERTTPLWIIAALFLVVVLLVARWRDLFALIGLAFAGGVLGVFVLPALLAGKPPVLVGVVGASAIILVVLYTAHGSSARTTTALLGTYGGLVLTALIGVVAVRITHPTGLSSDEGSLLQSLAGQLGPRDLLSCAIILAGLGVLNDVTITQTSAVWEHHIASTTYTIVFAYAGGALPVLLLLALYDQSLATALTSNDLAEEVVRTLASAIGLVLAVPLTTAMAVIVVRTDGVVTGSGHGHALPPR